MSSSVGDKLWHLCHTLRHDGIGYMDYIEQITYLLFLKMADEKAVQLPKGCRWPDLRDLAGETLTETYIETLRNLGKAGGILTEIYSGAQSRFTKPVNLKAVINLIDEVEWTSLGVDVKAEAYEHLLEKAASEGKKGAGQYFTPRKLMQSICRCIRPDPRVSKDFTVCDPACGTGGWHERHWEAGLDGTPLRLWWVDVTNLTELGGAPTESCVVGGANCVGHGIDHSQWSPANLHRRMMCEQVMWSMCSA